MTNENFFVNLGFTIILSSLIVIGLSYWAQTGPYSQLGWFSILMFSCLSGVVFLLGKKTVDHPVRTRFIGVTIANMMLKMFFSIALILVYYKWKGPQSPYFILPFIIIYLIYTIFETKFLLNLANQKKER